jgi:hypothetical protein
VQVGCDYFAGAHRHLTVELDYALPTDPNPVSDFDFGCSDGGVNWDGNTRAFRIASPDEWAIVAFLDPSHQLSQGDVPAFKDVARKLLRNAEGFAHTCSLVVRPTTSVSQVRFSFATLTGDAGHGLVYTTAGAEPAASWPVVSVTAPDISLHILLRHKPYLIRFRIPSGVNFFPARKGRNASVTLGVKLVSTRLPGCVSRASGHLVLSAGGAVTLIVCSYEFRIRARVMLTQYSR